MPNTTDTKPANISVQLTGDQADAFRRAADERGMSMSRLAEMMIDYALPRLRPMTPDQMFVDAKIQLNPPGTRSPTGALTGDGRAVYNEESVTAIDDRQEA